MKKILILGYNQQETKIYRFIKNFDKNIAVYNSKKVEIKIFYEIRLNTEFGYRHIIDKFTIKKLQRPIINLHMSCCLITEVRIQIFGLLWKEH